MDGGLPIGHPIKIAGESSQLSASPNKKSDTVGDIATRALSQQQEALSDLKTTPRLLSLVLPPLKGTRHVGRSSVIIKVPENHKANCNREIGIEIFAPIRNESTNKVLLEMVKDNFERIKGMRIEDLKIAGKDPNTVSNPELDEEQKKTLKTHSSDSTEPVEAWPIVIFSHGLRLDPTVYRPLVEEIASHKYIVLNVNHPASSSRAEFSKEALDLNKWDKLMDSEKVEREKDVKTVGKLEEIYKEIDVWEDDMVVKETNNIRFIVEQIRNGKLNGLLKDSGNKTPIILAGHSLGGTVSMIAARDNPNITGCINLDGRLAGKDTNERTANSETPTLLYFIEREDQEINTFLKNNPSPPKK